MLTALRNQPAQYPVVLNLFWHPLVRRSGGWGGKVDPETNSG